MVAVGCAVLQCNLEDSVCDPTYRFAPGSSNMVFMENPGWIQWLICQRVYIMIVDSDCVRVYAPCGCVLAGRSSGRVLSIIRCAADENAKTISPLG